MKSLVTKEQTRRTDEKAESKKERSFEGTSVGKSISAGSHRYILSG